MKDFFGHQDKARRNTVVLIVLFMLSIAVISVVVLALYGISLYLLSLYMGNPYEAPRQFSMHMLWVASSGAIREFYMTGGVLAAIVVLMALHKYYSYSKEGSGDKIALSLGGVPLVDPQTDKEKELLNITQEIALAAGIPPPKVYVIEGNSINAFAAGKSIDHAVIGVTRGAMEKLSRNEMKGVISHEFSHITNGDMLLNIRILSVAAGLSTLTMLGYIMLRASSGRRSNGKLLLPALMLILLGFMGVMAARVIQAAISRQREYLADATAVQYTRNPSGIAGALYKISLDAEGATINSESGLAEKENVSEHSHYFFAHPLSMKMNSVSRKPILYWIYSTHPPLQDRLDRVLPDWRDRVSKGTRSPESSKKPSA